MRSRAISSHMGTFKLLIYLGKIYFKKNPTKLLNGDGMQTVYDFICALKDTDAHFSVSVLNLQMFI